MNPETGEALQVVLVTEPTSPDFSLCDPSMVALSSAATTEVNLSEYQEEKRKKEDNTSAGSLSIDAGHTLQICEGNSGIENGFSDEMPKEEDLPSEIVSSIEQVENSLLDYNILEAAEGNSDDGGHPLETASVHIAPGREGDDFSRCLQSAKEDGNNTLLLQCKSSAPGRVCFVNNDSDHVPNICKLNSIRNGFGDEMVKGEELQLETACKMEPVENVILDRNVSVAAASDSMDGGYPLETASVHTVPEREVDDFSKCLKLPKEAGKNTILLQCESSAPGGVCFIIIVGTAHVSKASCAEVRALIQHVKPQHVFLELCKSRVSLLLPLNNIQVPKLGKMVEMYKRKEMNLFGLMYSWFLAKVGEKMEVQPGMEFRVGYEEAVKCGAEVALGDRPIQITLRRAWGMLTLWSKTKLIYSILLGCIFMPTSEELAEMMKTMEENDEITFMIQELSKSFPTLSETLIRERDLYMVASLRQLAHKYSSIVAVVGRGHLTGIAKNWNEDIDVEELMLVPVQRHFMHSVSFRSAAALLVGGLAVVAGVHYLNR